MYKLISQKLILEELREHRSNVESDDHALNIMYCIGIDNAISRIENQPAVDAVPVVHADWMQEFISKDVYCSNCRREIWTREEFEDLFDLYKSYCPCCGAKMDGNKTQI